MKKRWLSAITLCLLTACAVSPTGRKQLLLMGNNDISQMGLSSFQQIKQKEKSQLIHTKSICEVCGAGDHSGYSGTVFREQSRSVGSSRF
jgi:hypothetical protein